MTSKKKLNVPGSAALCLLLAACFLFTTRSALAQEIFLRADWLINVASPAASIWAGGTESSGTTNDSPHSANNICLAESAIGQITAQSAGYPNAANDLAVLGNNARIGGNAFRYTPIGPLSLGKPAVAWDVVFPGGFDPATGQTYPANATNTYIASDIAQADYDFRAVLEVNPADTDAAQQLVLLVEDQMLPWEWSGTMAMAYSTYARLNGLSQNGTNEETIVVEDARGYFQNACNVFAQFLANPCNATLVEGQNLLLSAAVTNQVAQVVDDYLRNLSEYAESSLTDFQLRSMANFYDPTVQGSQPLPGLLSEIDSTVNQIQMMLLLASPFQANLPAFTTSSAGQIKSIVRDMRRLHQSIVLGRVTFYCGASVIANNPLSPDASQAYGEYTTAFVPFFTGLTGANNSGFEVALNLAQNTFVPYAAKLESAASVDIAAVLQGKYDWATDQLNLRNQYLSQLQNLCGYFPDPNETPDIFFAALPPGMRETTAAQYAQDLPSGVYQLAQTGTIYQQWQSFKSAQTNLLLTSIQLSNTFATMIEDQQVANAIYSNQVRLAELILTNGQQISAIDVQNGQIQAHADLVIAQIQAAAAQTEAENSAFGSLGGIVSGGLGFSVNPGAFTGAIATLANGYDQASADLQIADVQANEAKQIAALNAQIEQINANEQAQAEYVQADTTMLNLSAQLNALGLQANSQEVQIQLAAQQVDQERSKLANLMSQVSSLLNQWMRSASLLSQNPEFSTNYLIIRDKTIQQANDAFLLAQEWAFLAALCFNYKDGCTNATSFVPSVLQARTTSDLIPILNLMASADTLFTTSCGNQPYYQPPVQFSIRNNSFQVNQYSGIDTNTVVSSYEPVLQGGTVLTNAAASRTAWTTFLLSNIITNPSPPYRVLTLNFSTSLNPQYVGGLGGSQVNPLFLLNSFGATLYAPANSPSNPVNSVQVSFVVQGFSFPQSPDYFTINLAQLGTSVIRNRPYGDTSSSSPAFRYFNFGPYSAEISASANNLAGTGLPPGGSGSNGTANFQDRSPANTQWQLTIDDGPPNNQALLNNLSLLTDIQLQFTIRSYTQ